MAKVLLLPSYLGGGYGHIGRCLAVAAELERRGWRTTFALGGHHAGRVAAGGIPVEKLRKPYRPKPKGGAGPAFTVFSDFNYQLVRDGLQRPAAIRASLVEQLRMVRRVRPDLLVSDSWPLASILGYLGGLPLAQIVRPATHPLARRSAQSSSSRLIWWQPPPEELIPPDLRPIFNPLMKAWGLPPIESGEDLLRGDLYLTPSIPELDPLPEGLENTHYTGPLTRPQEDAQSTPAGWGDALGAGRPLVYVTLGGGAGAVGGPAFYKILFEALGSSGLQVIASTGARLSPRDLPAPPANIRLASWAPGPALIARSNLVVYPGGYGTTMELVQAGVPGLVIPYHSEQESNGRRLEAAGAGRVLLPVKGAPRPVWQRWPGGRFSYLVYGESHLSPETLREAVLSLIEDKRARENAGRLQAAAQTYGGPALAADLIEMLV